MIAAKYLAPKRVTGIGILGTGEQARLQLQLLKEQLITCPTVYLWGRNIDNMQTYKQEMEDFDINLCSTPKEAAQQSNVIITTTAAYNSLLFLDDIQPGTHITAVGADSPGKQELDPALFQLADIVTVDSKSQCIAHGETSHAIQQQFIQESQLVELGEIITDPSLRRINDNQTTIADLTGVAVQDIQIAKSILKYDHTSLTK